MKLLLTTTGHQPFGSHGSSPVADDFAAMTGFVFKSVKAICAVVPTCKVKASDFKTAKFMPAAAIASRCSARQLQPAKQHTD